MHPTAIGPFRIERELGRGGMGEVYLARDTRLDRQVAIKSLPAHLAQDPDRLARFQREAKVLASLNHPGIGAIYGLEEADGHQYLVLEYVEGQTLADRLSQGPIQVDEAMNLAKQIAEALEIAHEKGIVHRDLKPGNVMVTPDGAVKVLDFGLARTADATASTTNAPALADSPTVTSPAKFAHSPTIPGVIMGTAGYMSPEQARGKPVDKRSDIFSFGCVLYEMLTGTLPFRGETVADSIGATLHKETDLNLLPAEAPPGVKRLLRRCLAKDRRARLHDIADARIELEQLASDTEASGTRPAGSSRTAWIVAAASGCLAVFSLVALIIMFRVGGPVPAAPAPVTKFVIDASGIDLNAVRPMMRLSRDGQTVAYSAKGKVWLRRMDQLQPRSLSIPWDASLMAWTYDGKSLVVLKGLAQLGELWLAPLDGAAPRLICRLPETGWLWVDSVSCTPDERVLLGMASAGLFECPLRGGIAKLMLAPGPNELLVCPNPLPDDSAVLFLEVNSGRIEALQQGRRRVLLDLQGDRLNGLSLAGSDHVLLSVSSGRMKDGVWSIRFDPRRLEVISSPTRILDSGIASASDTGVLAFSARPPARELCQLVLVNRDGTIAGSIGEVQMQLSDPRLSPSGEQIAVSASSDLSANEWLSDIFILDRKTGTRIQLPDNVGSDLSPYWRDGGRIVGFSTFNAGIRQVRERAADGSGEVSQIAQDAMYGRPTPDDQHLLVRYTSLDIIDRRTGKRTPFVNEPVTQFDIAPDGNAVAYVIEGERGIRLRRFPDGAGLVSVTSQDARSPRWSAEGKELYFISGEKFMASRIDWSGSRPEVGPPELLFDLKPNRLRSRKNFDVTPDGKFLMVQSAEDPGAEQHKDEILVIQNWQADVNR